MNVPLKVCLLRVQWCWIKAAWGYPTFYKQFELGLFWMESKMSVDVIVGLVQGKIGTARCKITCDMVQFNEHLKEVALL